MTTDKQDKIYDMHSAAFKSVAAWLITDKQGVPVANISFKFPKDGAGRLYCYFHIYGTLMVRAFANGYGYDKKTAAAVAAVKQIKPLPEGFRHADYVAKIKEALKEDGGFHFDTKLQDAGFRVYQVL